MYNHAVMFNRAAYFWHGEAKGNVFFFHPIQKQISTNQCDFSGAPKSGAAGKKYRVYLIR